LPGFFSLEDVFCFQKLIYALNVIKGVPVCHLNHNFIIPRDGRIRIFNFKKLSKILNEFEKNWEKEKNAAKIIFFSRLKLMMGKYFSILENGFRNQFFSDNFLELLIGCSATVFNFDERPTIQQCLATSLNPGPERNISRCEENIRLHAVADKII
jgi:hypothetical protein